MSEQWRAGGGKARRTSDKYQESGINPNTRDGLRTAAVHGCPPSADRHRNRALLHPFAFDIPFMSAIRAPVDVLGNVLFESSRWDYPTGQSARGSHDVGTAEGMSAAPTEQRIHATYQGVATHPYA